MRRRRRWLTQMHIVQVAKRHGGWPGINPVTGGERVRWISHDACGYVIVTLSKKIKIQVRATEIILWAMYGPAPAQFANVLTVVGHVCEGLPGHRWQNCLCVDHLCHLPKSWNRVKSKVRAAYMAKRALHFAGRRDFGYQYDNQFDPQ